MRLKANLCIYSILLPSLALGAGPYGQPPVQPPAQGGYGVQGYTYYAPQAQGQQPYQQQYNPQGQPVQQYNYYPQGGGGQQGYVIPGQGGDAYHANQQLQQTNQQVYQANVNAYTKALAEARLQQAKKEAAQKENFDADATLRALSAAFASFGRNKAAEDPGFVEDPEDTGVSAKGVTDADRARHGLALKDVPAANSLKFDTNPYSAGNNTGSSSMNRSTRERREAMAAEKAAEQQGSAEQPSVPSGPSVVYSADGKSVVVSTLTDDNRKSVQSSYVADGAAFRKVSEDSSLLEEAPGGDYKRGYSQRKFDAVGKVTSFETGLEARVGAETLAAQRSASATESSNGRYRAAGISEREAGSDGSSYQHDYTANTTLGRGGRLKGRSVTSEQFQDGEGKFEYYQRRQTAKMGRTVSAGSTRDDFEGAGQVSKGQIRFKGNSADDSITKYKAKGNVKLTRNEMNGKLEDIDGNRVTANVDRYSMDTIRRSKFKTVDQDGRSATTRQKVTKDGQVVEKSGFFGRWKKVDEQKFLDKSKSDKERAFREENLAALKKQGQQNQEKFNNTKRGRALASLDRNKKEDEKAFNDQGNVGRSARLDHRAEKDAIRKGELEKTSKQKEAARLKKESDTKRAELTKQKQALKAAKLEKDRAKVKEERQKLADARKAKRVADREARVAKRKALTEQRKKEQERRRAERKAVAEQRRADRQLRQEQRRTARANRRNAT